MSGTVLLHPDHVSVKDSLTDSVTAIILAHPDKFEGTGYHPTPGKEILLSSPLSAA